MQSSNRKKKRLMGEINVVPYIDVMLVLLVIFMITTPLLSTGVQVDLPKVDAETIKEQQREPFIVTVDSQGMIYLNDNKEPIQSDEELKVNVNNVLTVDAKVPFYVRGDANASYTDVVHAMVLLQKAGVQSVGMVTDPL